MKSFTDGIRRRKLQIRPEQLNTLTAAQEADFRRRLRETLREDYPEDCEELGDDRLAVVLNDGIGRARSYGIQTEEDIGLYFDVMFNLAYNFDTNRKYPWAAKILKDTALTAEDKLRQVSALAQEELDKEAAEEE